MASAVVAGWAAPAIAAAGDGTTPAFDVTIRVQADGTLRIREDITYDFTDNSHGIERYIPVRYRADSTRDRVITVSNVRVSSPSGAPADLQQEQQSDVLYLRIGNPDRTVIGRQRYVVEYDVIGALNTFPDEVQLYWDAIGTGWRTFIDRAQVTVQAPGIDRTTCFSGPQASTTLCDRSQVGGRQARFVQTGLPAGQGMTVVAAFPKSAVAAPPPVLEERWSLQRAFTADAPHLALAASTAALGVGAVAWLVYRRGRDRRFIGQVPGLTPVAGQVAAEEALPLGASREGPVEWQPPDDLRPGLVGTLIDEQANVLDVTATIVDLAVRRYLRIEELPRGGWFSSQDWQLTRLPAPDGQLLTYERLLLDALFKDGDVAKLSELKRHFAGPLGTVQEALYDEMVYRKWYNRRPDTTRTSWIVLALLAVAAAAALTYLLVRSTTFGLVGVAAVLAALALVAVARFMPARTGLGTATSARALGFKRYLATAEAGQLRYEEPEQIFSRYLPYAIVFGVTDHWAKVFQQLAAAGAVSAGATGLYWYAGPVGWSFGDFGSSMSSFSTVAAGSLSAAAASGSSGFGGGGFSGGGFGGGGGGGW